MLTRRGAILIPLAGIVAIAGSVYGVEEFELLAVAAGSLLAVAASLVAWQVVHRRSELRVEIGSPPAEVLVGDDAEIALHVLGTRRFALGIGIDEAWSWDVNFPGINRLIRGPLRNAIARERPRGRRNLHSLVLRARGLGVRASFRFVDTSDDRDSWDMSVPIPTRQRGVWSMDPVQVWCIDPFGLTCWRVAESPPAHVIVCPDPRGVPLGPSPVPFDVVAESDLPPLPAHRRPGTELAGLRSYAFGDRINRLHWPAMARTGELIVRDFVEPSVERVEILVDVRPAMIESSVRAAAVSGVGALATGLVVDLRTTAGERIEINPGAAGRTVLLHSLAAVAPLRRRRR